MRTVGVYSFNRGDEAVTSAYPHLLTEINAAIASVNPDEHKTKKSREKTMMGRMLYSPSSLNKALKAQFSQMGWRAVRVSCDYPSDYLAGYSARSAVRGAYREMDFVKEKLGVEIQFGKYAFMVYNVCAKMTIFRNLGHIDMGVEIVPVKAFVDEMSTGVSYFEQFVWDLRARGVADIDIPVLILGIDE